VHILFLSSSSVGPAGLPPFPTRRSSDLAGAAGIAAAETAQLKYSREFEQEADFLGLRTMSTAGYDPRAMGTFFKSLLTEQRVNQIGKSTRLNSSHVSISYAVFCLNKKKQ